jgi:hypothetical protein
MAEPSSLRDLGVLDGPLLLFGGPYGNLEATRALLEEAARRGIPANRIICTGDLAAYCAEPQACVDLLRANAIATVMGNCEEQLAADKEDCGCGFAEGTACAALSLDWYGYCRKALDAEAKSWMGRLPHRIAFRLGGKSFVAVHGGFSGINRFLFASSPEDEIAAEFEAAAAEGLAPDGVIGGHCGLPFTRLLGDKLWHNAGAIGLPANDGTARVWFSLLLPMPGGLRIERLPLAYDHAAAARKMRAHGLPESYAAALESGLWPSMDVLPAAERQVRGGPLSPEASLWPSLDKAPVGPRIGRPGIVRPGFAGAGNS